MVDKVRFSTGGFDAKYADKMSSVLDIEYRKPAKWEGDLSASLLGASAYMGWGNKKVSISHSLRYKTNSYMLGALETDAEYSPNFIDYQAYISSKEVRDFFHITGFDHVEVIQPQHYFQNKSDSVDQNTIDEHLGDLVWMVHAQGLKK